MNIAEELDNFIKNNDSGVFIEVEGKPSVLKDFYERYNAQYSANINKTTDGVIELQDNANKWGIELRLYLHVKPTCIKATKNTVYRSEYPYRINDKEIIKELFRLGYHIGRNE